MKTNKKKFPLYKNVIFLSISFTLLFTSFSSMENLQSSVNKNLGITSLWTIYLCFIISCLFLPSFLIRKLGAKWTVALSMLCYSTYIAAQLYPRYYTLIPTAILVGLGAGCLWTAMSVYVTQSGEKYAELFSETAEVSVARFFSLFYFGTQTSQIWGNFISSTVFSVGVNNVTRSEDFLRHCGADYCSSFAVNLTEGSHEDGPESPDEMHKLTILSYICLASSLLGACVVAVFVQPSPKKRNDADAGKASLWADLSATCVQFLKLDQILLIPITTFMGLHAAFLIGDVTSGYISCGLVVHMVGYFMMCYGISNACTAGLIGHFVKRFGQLPAFVLGFASSLSTLILLLLWKPDSSYSSTLAVAIIIASLGGFSDGLWNTQINVFYGITFDESPKAAFSNLNIWKSLGYMLAFILSTLICVRIKIYILLVTLLIGMTGYCTVKLRHR